MESWSYRVTNDIETSIRHFLSIKSLVFFRVEGCISTIKAPFHFPNTYFKWYSI